MAVAVLGLIMIAGASAYAQQYEFERSPGFQKLDLRARSAWRGAMHAGDRDRDLKCLIKVSERLDQRQKQALVRAGLKPGTIIKTIVTGRIEAKDVPDVAGLDFVRIIELAVPMSIKEDPGYRKYGMPRSSRPKAAVPKPEKKKAPAEEEPATQKGVGEPAKTAPTAAPPVKQGEVEVEIPIYETTRPPETYPNKPPTSSELVDDEPAVAPVDQANVPIGTKPTLTQPIVGKQKEVQVEVETGPEQTAEPPVYAPSQGGQ